MKTRTRLAFAATLAFITLTPPVEKALWPDAPMDSALVPADDGGRFLPDTSVNFRAPVSGENKAESHAMRADYALDEVANGGSSNHFVSGTTSATEPGLKPAPANLTAMSEGGLMNSGLQSPGPGNATIANARYVRLGGASAKSAGWEEHRHNQPAARSGHTAVWTGSEMIVWGGVSDSRPGYLNDGWRYNPATNSWTAVTTIGAPSFVGRGSHSAVWTGSQMIVWGVDEAGKRGGRYDPVSNSWIAVNTTGAPAAAGQHQTVWTGSEMIVWGGGVNEGGRYNPTSDSWTPVSDSGAPAARGGHTAVWTGTEMIVWGGTYYDGLYHWLNDGGRYNPAGNSWSALSAAGAPAARSAHTAVWTGSEMIVWGGEQYGVHTFTDGGRYHPATNSWTAVNTAGAPPNHYNHHTAVWTGTEMIVWDGGSNNGRYDPAANSWTTVTTTGAPVARANHTAVWTGKEMIVWGGGSGNNDFFSNDGGRYDPAADSWIAVANTGAASPRGEHTAVWTGSEMIIWGGYINGHPLGTGARYNPSTNNWTPVSNTGAPSARHWHTAVWTGTEMIIWGGEYTGNSGGRYDPVTNRWAPVSATGAPAPRDSHTAVWTGKQMIVWGGEDGDGDPRSTGGSYDPAANVWTPVSTSGAPSAREFHAAVWTGSEMIVWGGEGGGSTGGRYDPMANSWSAVSTIGAPAARDSLTAVWTGSEMIVWGGAYWDYFNDESHYLNNGGRYNPASDSWTPVTTTGAPAPRTGHTAVWTGSEMIVWGGESDSGCFNDGGRYNPAGNSWTAITKTGAPTGRHSHTAVWTGDEMIIWGGGNCSGYDSSDILSYRPEFEDFRITSIVRDSGNLTLGFPSVTGRNYTLWRSDTLAEGAWTNTGLTSIAGTGAVLSFTVPAPGIGVLKRFYRVRADN